VAVLKGRAVSLSFDYLVDEDGKGSDGSRGLKEIDPFEVTITPAPANADIRFISMSRRPPGCPSDRSDPQPAARAGRHGVRPDDLRRNSEQGHDRHRDEEASGDQTADQGRQVRGLGGADGRAATPTALRL
jgi:hypothetical protein